MKTLLIILIVIVPSLCFGQEKSKREAKPRYIVDGVLMEKDRLPDLKAEDIASISLLKDSANIGKDTDDHTIVITTKPQREESNPENEEEEEWEIIVFDAGYEGFLATQHAKEFYSESSLKVKNTMMVAEWNYRYRLPSAYNPNIYEVSIDYRPMTDYGLEFEYRLYMFFRFMEKEHSISLLGNK